MFARNVWCDVVDFAVGLQLLSRVFLARCFDLAFMYACVQVLPSTICFSSSFQNFEWLVVCIITYLPLDVMRYRFVFEYACLCRSHHGACHIRIELGALLGQKLGLSAFRVLRRLV